MLGYYGYYIDYIHSASKFTTSANIGNNKAAYYICWMSKLATSADKCGSKTSPQMKTNSEELKKRYPGYPPC